MSKNLMEPALSIPAFYSGRSILLTGASGYLGKTLIEKLLRSCPDTREIFLLMRPKKNVNINERLQELLMNPLFDTLRSKQPHCFEKLIPVEGDISAEELGLSPADRDMLIEKISIIFHVAANVKFEDTFKNAVLTNVRSTRDICILGKRIKNLVALVHASSTFTQVDKPVVDEIVYPMEIDWRKTIQIAETLNESILETFSSKYIGTMPNHYVFTKRLAEQVIIDFSKSLPCVIYRSSIFSPTLNEPIKGWSNSFNGPVALMIGGGKGLLRVLYSDPDCRDNYIPIDIVVKAMIVAGWKCGTTINAQDTLPLVYNCAANHSTNPSRVITMQIVKEASVTYPLEGIIWAPGTIIVHSLFLYRMLVLLLHVIPAVIIDGLLRVIGRHPRLLKLQRKIFISNYCVAYFLLNVWDFRNKKLLSLSGEVPPDNQRDFGFAADINCNFNKGVYFKNCIIGSKIFLLHESVDACKLNAAKSHYIRMVWIDRIVKALISVLCLWITYKSRI